MTHALPALNPAISPVWHMLQMWRVLHLSISAASWAVYVRIIFCSRYLPHQGEGAVAAIGPGRFFSSCPGSRLNLQTKDRPKAA